MGWKMIYLARRNPALAPEQFPQAWREHSALGAGCTNVRDKVLSVTQCSRVLEGPPLPGASSDYDGVNLLALRDLQAATDIWNDAETLAIMRPDEPRVFSTYVREFTLVCQERVLRDAPRGRCCVVGFLRRRPGLTRAGFQQAWAVGEASELKTAGFTEAGRVVHNDVHADPPPGYDYDGIAEWWFESADTARRALDAGDLRSALRPALDGITALDQSVFMFTRVTHSRP
jgi:hypothetical protein